MKSILPILIFALFAIIISTAYSSVPQPSLSALYSFYGIKNVKHI